MIFIKNNINFRQVSALAQSNFLRSKSFMLNEVLKSEKHVFSSTSKEILLQTYKVWTDLLIVTEDFFVSNSKSVCDAEALDFLNSEAKKRVEVLRKHFVSKPEWFDQEFINVWLEIQDSRKVQLKQTLSHTALNESATSAYNSMTLHLISFMNHVLFTLHEIDYLLYFNDREDFLPFVYIDTVDVNFNIATGNCYSSTRIDIYRALNLLNTETIEIKNGFRKEQLEDDSKFAKAYKAITSEIESRGITIGCIT